MVKLQQGPRWRSFRVTLLSHIFQDGKLLSFPELRNRFNLPSTMYYSYLQLSHAVAAQGDANHWLCQLPPFST